MRAPMTFERYARVMHIDPCAFQGIIFYSGCDALSCAERKALAGDIAFAIQKINDALGQYEMSLSDQEIIVNTSAPYWIKEEGCELRQLITEEVEVPVTYTAGSDCVKVAVVQIQYDAAPDQQFEGATVVEGLNACSNYPFDWEVTGDENGFILSTFGYNLANVTDDQAATYPEIIKLRLVTSIPTVIDAIHCGKCGESVSHPCYSQFDGKVKIAIDPCSCGTPRYEFKAIRRGVSDEATDDAIVSLANYRQAIKKCTNCSYEAQSRLNRDLGITEKGEDMRVKAPAWAFNNGFGIQTPGALAAWNAITLKFGSAGVAGYA